MPTSQEFSVNKLGQKGVVHLLLPIILLLGLVAGVYLVTSGNPLKIFSKASNPPIVFKSLDGKVLPTNSNGVYQTTSPNVRAELTSTLGPPASVSGPVSGPGRVGTVSYRAGFDRIQLNSAVFISYIQEPTTYTVTFPNTSGAQFYWAEFKASDGRADRRSAQIEIVRSSVSGPISTTTPTQAPTPTSAPIISSCPDLALRKPVKSSGWWSNGNPEKAVDGSDSTMWRTNRSSGAWLYVDLGSVQSINQVKLIWFWDDSGSTWATSTIQVSTNARDWKRIAQSTHTRDTNKRQKETLNFIPTQARYVKFYGVQWNRGWADMQTFEVYNTNCTSTPAPAPTPVITPLPTSTPTSTPRPTPPPAQTSKRVFVTSTAYDGNLGGLAGADSKCQERTNAANLGGTWKAWLSSSTLPASARLNHNNSTYTLLNGQLVALNWNDLIDGSHINSIWMTELKTNAREQKVWTNTTAAGNVKSFYDTCGSWTQGSSSYQGRGWSGMSGRYNFKWTEDTSALCNSQARLYCFEQ